MQELFDKVMSACCKRRVQLEEPLGGELVEATEPNIATEPGQIYSPQNN